MRLKKVLWYKKIFPIFHLESKEYFDKHIYLCVKTLGPIVLTREDGTCGSKKIRGIKYAEQFYRSFIIGWLLSLVSIKLRLLYEIAVAARYLASQKGTTLEKNANLEARYIWSERGFRDYTTVEDIKKHIIKKHSA